MTTPTAPIVITRIDGVLTAVGPADRILPALDGQTPLTIEDGRCTGDTVYTRPRQTWGDDSIVMRTIAREIQHPEHGRVIAAWVDDRRLDDAPQADEMERVYKVKTRQAMAETDRRIAEMDRGYLHEDG